MNILFTIHSHIFLINNEQDCCPSIPPATQCFGLSHKPNWQPIQSLQKYTHCPVRPPQKSNSLSRWHNQFINSSRPSHKKNSSISPTKFSLCAGFQHMVEPLSACFCNQLIIQTQSQNDFNLLHSSLKDDAYPFENNLRGILWQLRYYSWMFFLGFASRIL